MKQTERYQLNQWESPDRILMSDFNADNQKIEAAIRDTAAMPHGELLRSAEADGNDSRLLLDVAGVEWSRYFLAMLRVEHPEQPQDEFFVVESAVTGLGASTRVPGGATWDGYVGHNIHKGNGMALIPVFYDGTSPHTILTVGLTVSGGYSMSPLNSVRYFIYKLRSSGNVPEGMKLSLWCLR